MKSRDRFRSNLQPSGVGDAARGENDQTPLQFVLTRQLEVFHLIEGLTPRERETFLSILTIRVEHENRGERL